MKALGPALRVVTLYRGLYLDDPSTHYAPYVSHLRWMLPYALIPIPKFSVFSDALLEKGSNVEMVQE